MLKVRGVSMIEVLVTLVVTAVGLLGVASLQMNAVKNARESQMRSIATVLAHDMAERMRSNLTGLSVPNQFYDQMEGGAVETDCRADTCTPDQLAQFDYWDWSQQLADLLPSGTGVVCIDSTPDDGVDGDGQCDVNLAIPATYAIKIFWDEDGDGERESRFVTKVLP